MNLKDKVVIVTGASPGIGAEIALAFAKEGANIVVAYRNNKKGALETKKKIEKLGVESLLYEGDLSKETNVQALVGNTVSRFGTIDVLVNNAGKAEPKEILDTNKEDWLKAFDDNFFSMVLCTKEVLRVMKKNIKGKIINISSINGLEHVGRPGNIAYSAAKAAVINFTKTLAKGYAPDIQINAIAPGKTLSDYWKQFDNRFLEKAVEDVPLKRFIDPEEIAMTAVFLAENDALTGELIIADAGFNLKQYV